MWLKNIATFSRSSNNIRSSKKPVACNFRLCGRRIPENWKPGSLLPVSPASVQQGWGRWSRAGERGNLFSIYFKAIDFEGSQEPAHWSFWVWVVLYKVFPLPGMSFSCPSCLPLLFSSLLYWVSNCFPVGRRGELPSPQAMSSSSIPWSIWMEIL